MTVVLDAGALIALDRGDRRTGLLLEKYERRSELIVTSAAVVAQVWRGGSRQARLGRGLKGVRVRPLDIAAGRRVGELLGAANTQDVVDAHLTLLIHPADTVLTSDPGDVRHLLDTRRVPALIIEV